METIWKFVRGLMTICFIPAFYIPQVFADGCPSSRAETKQERAIFESAYNKVRAALPPQPPGWVIKESTMKDSAEKDCGEGWCSGMYPEVCVTDPVVYSFRFNYAESKSLSTTQEKPDQDFADALQKMAALKNSGTPQQRSRMAELDKKIEKLKMERDQAPNSAEQSRINKEIGAAKKERSIIEQQRNMAYIEKQMSDARAEEIGKNLLDAEIRITINNRWRPNCAKPQPQAGMPQAYWCPEGQVGKYGRYYDSGDSPRGTLAILLGEWNEKGAVLPESVSVATKPLNMAISISAGREMAENMARQMKLELLKAQLGR